MYSDIINEIINVSLKPSQYSAQWMNACSRLAMGSLEFGFGILLCLPAKTVGCRWISDLAWVFLLLSLSSICPLDKY